MWTAAALSWARTPAFDAGWSSLQANPQLRPVIAILKLGPISRLECGKKFHDKFILSLLFHSDSQ
jgi:hypothetical protein